MSEQNKALVQQAYNNFKAGNIDALLNLMSDDISWTLPEIESVPFAGRRTGRDNVSAFFATVNESQESLRFEPRELIAEGGRVVALGSYDWRVKTTGRQFSGDFAHVWTVRDGKLAAFHEYTDTAACKDAYQKAMTA